MRTMAGVHLNTIKSVAESGKGEDDGESRREWWLSKGAELAEGGWTESRKKMS